MEIEEVLHRIATGELSRSDVRHAAEIVFVQEDKINGGGWMVLGNGLEKVSPERFDAILEIRSIIKPGEPCFSVSSPKSGEPSAAMKVVAAVKERHGNKGENNTQ